MNYPEFPDSWINTLEEFVKKSMYNNIIRNYCENMYESYYKTGYYAGLLIGRIVLGFGLQTSEYMIHKDFINNFKELIKDTNAKSRKKYTYKLEYLKKDYYILTIEEVECESKGRRMLFVGKMWLKVKEKNKEKFYITEPNGKKYQVIFKPGNEIW